VGLDAEATAHFTTAMGLEPENAIARKALGFEKVKGVWLSGEELYRAKDWVEYHGRWMPKTDLKRLQARQDRFREESKMRADWANAWELKTQHFRIRSNCPPTVVQDLAKAIEVFYESANRIFNGRRTQIIPVEIFATQEQFQAESAKQGFPVGTGTLGYFYSGGEMGIRCFYAGSLERTQGVIFHECTHLLIRSAYHDVPTWANEGMAVFFELARLTDRGLDIRTVPFDRLWQLKELIDHGEVDLNHLVQLDGSGEYSVEYYPQGWGVIHYLLYGAGGKRLPLLQKFYEMKSRKGPMADFRTIFGCEPKDLFADWKQYIAQLEPATPAQFLAAAAAAIDYAHEPDRALGYLEKGLGTGAADGEQLAIKGHVLLQVARLRNDAALAGDAAAVLAAAVEKRPPERRRKPRNSDLQVLYEEGLAWIGAGDQAKAVGLAEDILEVNDFHAGAYRLLALAQATAPEGQRDLAEAKANLQVADDLGPGHENEYVRARIAEAEGRLELANKLLADAVEGDLFGFGGAFYRQEQYRIMAKGGKGGIEVVSDGKGGYIVIRGGTRAAH
jgi:hypothetical protein